MSDEKFNTVKINADHSVEIKVAGSLEVNLPAEPSINQTASLAPAPAQHESMKAEIEKVKAPGKKAAPKPKVKSGSSKAEAIYMSAELRYRLEAMKLDILGETGISVTKTDVGRAAFESLLADYERLGLDAPGIKLLLHSK